MITIASLGVHCDSALRAPTAYAKAETDSLTVAV